MKNAIFVHGSPGRLEYTIVKALRLRISRFHWAGWLRRELLKRGYEVDAPEMPRAYDPQWDAWRKEVEKFKIDQDTTLLGHSCGGGFWLRYLSEHPRLKVGKVILTAPWIDVEKKRSPEFFNFILDKNLAERTKGIVIFYSDDDMDVIKSSMREIRKQLKNVQYREFHNYGHFTLQSMRSTKFLELLEECLEH